MLSKLTHREGFSFVDMLLAILLTALVFLGAYQIGEASLQQLSHSALTFQEKKEEFNWDITDDDSISCDIIFHKDPTLIECHKIFQPERKIIFLLN